MKLHGYICSSVTSVLMNRMRGAKAPIPIEVLLNGLKRTHELVGHFREFEVDVFELLGMRNLSSFIGELFAASTVKSSEGLFVKNPHQDGYPDLLLHDESGKAHWATLQQRLREKNPFSPFGTGGLEVKATCGSVPDPKRLATKGLVKPAIGDTRITMMVGYDWKAHHRTTNNLLGLLWDFRDRAPCVVAVF